MYTLALLLPLFIGCMAQSRQLTILHTNDIHGQFLPSKAMWRADSALVGGFAALSGALDSVRLIDESCIYLDAGDLMTGNPICNIVADGVEGGALLKLLQLCDCDAAAVGNHEFDLGPEHAKKFLSNGELKWLCGNVVEKSSGASICDPYVILEENGLKVGVIGLLLTDLKSVVASHAVEPFEVQPIEQRAQVLIDEIDPITDVIILLTHNGFEQDKVLARSVTGADIIVGGHSHTRLSNPQVENGIIIVQAGSHLKHLGVLKIRVAKDEIVEHEGDLIELESNRYTPDASVSLLCNEYRQEIELVYGEIIANASETLTRAYSSTSSLGNLLCDLLRKHYNCDFAVINSGGIRKDLARGPIRKLDVVEMLPFFNTITLFEASGKDLATMINKQAVSFLDKDSEVLQVSGIAAEVTGESSESFSVNCFVDGSELDSSRTYRGVSIDYVLVSQPEKYLGFTPDNLENTGLLFSDFVTQELQKSTGPIAPDHQPRIYHANK